MRLSSSLGAVLLVSIGSPLAHADGLEPGDAGQERATEEISLCATDRTFLNYLPFFVDRENELVVFEDKFGLIEDDELARIGRSDDSPESCSVSDLHYAFERPDGYFRSAASCEAEIEQSFRPPNIVAPKTARELLFSPAQLDNSVRFALSHAVRKTGSSRLARNVVKKALERHGCSSDAIDEISI